MGQFAPPEKFRSDPTILLVGQDSQGRWMVQENHGFAEGAFVSREDAVRFAETERAHFPGAGNGDAGPHRVGIRSCGLTSAFAATRDSRARCCASGS